MTDVRSEVRESDAEPHAVRRAGRDHPVALGHVHRHRLFAEHVLAALGGGDGLLRVQADGRREHGIPAIMVLPMRESSGP